MLLPASANLQVWTVAAAGCGLAPGFGMLLVRQDSGPSACSGITGQWAGRLQWRHLRCKVKLQRRRTKEDLCHISERLRLPPCEVRLVTRCAAMAPPRLQVCRMAVGVGEASFVALAAPFIGGCSSLTLHLHSSPIAACAGRADVCPLQMCGCAPSVQSSPLHSPLLC